MYKWDMHELTHSGRVFIKAWLSMTWSYYFTYENIVYLGMTYK